VPRCWSGDRFALAQGALRSCIQQVYARGVLYRPQRLALLLAGQVTATLCCAAQAWVLICAETYAHVLLKHGTCSVALIVDNPAFNIVQENGVPRKLSGATLLRNYVLQKSGISVFSVPVFAWRPGHVATSGFESWLRDELAARGVPTIDVGSAASAPLPSHSLVTDDSLMSDDRIGSTGSERGEAAQIGMP
jgi:hypothetical protein